MTAAAPIAGKVTASAERRALMPYTAAVPLYCAALDGFTEDPAANLRGSGAVKCVRKAWLAAHWHGSPELTHA